MITSIALRAQNFKLFPKVARPPKVSAATLTLIVLKSQIRLGAALRLTMTNFYHLECAPSKKMFVVIRAKLYSLRQDNQNSKAWYSNKEMCASTH